MPNLQTLNLETFHREKYLEFILKSNSTQCLNHIQAIVSTQSCSYSSAYRSEFYFPVCYKYRATLIELDLEDLYSGYHYDKTLTLLSHFISLKTLCLRNPLDESLTIADLLKASPNLVTLDIDRRVHIFRPSASTAPSYYLNQNKSKNTVIKKLVLAMPSVPKGEIIYINDCLSTQLQHLIVDLDTDLNEWIGIVGIENVLKLVKRMGTMKQSALTFGSRTQPIQSNMTNYFKVFSAFKQDNLTCTAVYGKKSALRNKSLFEYGLQKCDYYRQTEDGQRVIEIALPDTSYSTIGPKNFNGLTIELNEPDSELAPAFLKYAMVNCPGLWRYDYINSANSHRIRIQVRRNPAQPYVIGDFTNEKEMLTVLATGSVIPSKLIMDQIAFCLPHIEIYSVSEASYRWLNNVNHPIDTTAFKNLKRFYLDLGRFYVGVHIEYTDGDKTHYLFEDSYQTLKENLFSVILKML
ncbi:uncharacterized protein EV154DRAFT_534232 [Mucor mucedo]|uniref:uncharacterized protein n=1 Tax=Mucor mucedo TaxID=29922 RepID=UPI00221E713B|nr:uncharacterized protein EV154DRAFT_534232 [Mucor mucedo]KAI7864213.1 hypothetical protein EV154DRAFT_534232 [Mucor mucedo]